MGLPERGGFGGEARRAGELLGQVRHLSQMSRPRLPFPRCFGQGPAFCVFRRVRVEIHLSSGCSALY